MAKKQTKQAFHTGAEEFLASRRQAEDIIQSLPDPTFVIDRHKIIVVWNRAVEEMTGVPAAEMIGKGDFAYSVPFWGSPRPVLIDLVMEFDDDSALPYDTIKREGRSLISEAFLPGFRGGDGIHVWLKASPLYDRDGNLIGAIEAIRDITELKKTEQRQRERMQFLEHMETIDRIIAGAMDLESLMSEVLEAVLEIFGCHRAWLLHPCDPDAPGWKVPMEKTAPNILGAGSAKKRYAMTPEVADAFRELLAANGPLTAVHEGRHPDWDPGDKYHVRSAMFMALRPKTGRPWNFGLHQCCHARIWTGAEKNLFREISRRMESGLSSLLFYRDLKISENRYRLMAENVSDVIWTLDMNFNFTYLSPSIYQQTGYTVSEVIAHSKRDILPHTLRYSKQLFDKKLAQIKKGDVEGWEPVTFELEQLCKDGRTIWTHHNARILPDANQNPASFLGITRDITDWKRTREMMVQSEKMLSVGGLAAGMAHEINNPLAGLMQTAEVVTRRLTDPDMPANRRAARETGISMAAVHTFMEKRGIGKMLGTIRESGSRMAGIVENMLSFARKEEAVVSSHDLAGLVDLTLELAGTDFDLKKHFDFRQIQIQKEYGGDVPPIPCERAKLQQVILNILRNGAQAMQEAAIEDPEFIVRITLEKKRKMVRLEIDDNGPGMDEATRKRIFEPFFTTKPSGVGTGLGLSVSYFIITENHGGELLAESSPGRGARFIIRLPLEGKARSLR